MSFPLMDHKRKLPSMVWLLTAISTAFMLIGYLNIFFMKGVGDPKAASGDAIRALELEAHGFYFLCASSIGYGTALSLKLVKGTAVRIAVGVTASVGLLFLFWIGLLFIELI